MQKRFLLASVTAGAALALFASPVFADAVSDGLALAKAIPDATFVGYHGMGHDLPHSMWREMNREILALIDRSGVEPTVPAATAAD